MGNDHSTHRQSPKKVENNETYEEFEKNVIKLDALLRKYVDPKNHCYVTLKIDPPLNKIEFSPMWKSQVRVIVTKVPTLPEFWECSLNPSGHPFYINHKEMTTQWQPPWEIPYPPILKSPPMWSWAYNELSSSFDIPDLTIDDPSPSPDDDEPDKPVGKCPDEDPPEPLECIVCFANKPTVVLPCAHAFCEECISQWKGRSDTCPVCRSSLKDEDENWVLAETPSDEEIAKYVREFLERAKSI